MAGIEGAPEYAEEALTVRIDPDGETKRVRTPRSLLARLDAVEAHHRGLGRRNVNRSVLVRLALEAWLPGVEAGIEHEKAQRAT